MEEKVVLKMQVVVVRLGGYLAAVEAAALLWSRWWLLSSQKKCYDGMVEAILLAYVVLLS